MAATTDLVRRARSHTPTHFVDVLRSAVKVARLRALNARASRRTRARLSMLGVPLAIVAALMSGMWWATVPLAACAWWWAPRYTGWEWVGAVGRGLIGAKWALIGSSAIVTFAHNLLIVGVLWLLGAGLLGLCGSFTARQTRRDAQGRPRTGTAVQMRLAGVPSVRRRFAMHLTIQRMPATRKPDD